MSNQKGMEPENKKKGKNIIIAVAFVVLLAALAVCIILLLKRQEEPAAVPERDLVDKDNADEIMSEMSQKVEEGMFECKMTSSWAFDDGKSASPNAYVANVESNRYSLYFDVYDNATNDLLYSSPILPVGTDIDNIKLDKELAAGEYSAVVMYTLVDEDDKEVSSVGFNITISVAN